MATQMKFKTNFRDFPAVRYFVNPLVFGKKLCLAFALLLLSLTPLSARGQVDTGAIVGSVQDSTGAAIPGATVTAKDEGTGIEHKATSDAAGEYTISPLPLGFYTLTFERQG